MHTMPIFLLAAFVLSGAAGLVYESIWTRYLGLFVGHGAYAQVLVLVIFLGGMSLGALAIGRRAERVRDPLVWYAAVELAVGLIGLVFHDAFVWTTRLAYDGVFPALGPGAMQVVSKWSIAAILILPQSILLGATFPLMTAGTLRRIPRNPGRTIALLYFANSLGAAAGVLLAGFVLIAIAGLPGTLLSAAMINIVVAGAVFIGSRSIPAVAIPDASGALDKVASGAGASDAVDPRLRRLLLAVSFGTAIASFVYEIGWIRMLSLVLGSATHSFELMLSAFILGLAIGALVIRRRAEGDRMTLRSLAIVQLTMGALAVATLPVYARSFDWMAVFMAAFTKVPEGYAGFSIARYVICLAVMLPATVCAGMTLPLITRRLMHGEQGERALGQVYGVNTLGSIVGVALAALVLLPLLGLKWMIVAGAAIDIALGAAILAFARRDEPKGTTPRYWMPAVAATAVAAVVGLTTELSRGVLTSGVYRYGVVNRRATPNILFFADGRTATVAVRRISAAGGLVLSTNGKPDASLGQEWFKPPEARRPFNSDASTQLLLPLITLAHVPNARVAAVVGQGSGMSSHTLLGDAQLTRVVTIEIEPQMLRASRAFYPANRRVFDDPRSSFAIEDARSYFASEGERYDLILSEPSNPWVAGVSGLFTTEFYEHVRRYLAPGGVFGQWLHLSELSDGLVLSVVRAIAENFPDYALYTVSNRDILIVATNDSTLPRPDWSVFARPGVSDDLRRVLRLTPAMLDALRIADASTLAPLVRGGGGNSDFYPILDLGAERARYLDEDATGFAGLSGDRFSLARLLGERRVGVNGAPYTAIPGVSRLEAMDLSARDRRGDYAGATPFALGAIDRARAVDRMLASNTVPTDWHLWVESLRDAEATSSGANAGVADTALYSAARSYMDRNLAPAEARAGVAFLHGLASRDFVEAGTAAGPLIAAEVRGDRWLDPDLLRDGAVVARLRTGDLKGARAVHDTLEPRSARSPNDLRRQLLDAWMSAAER
jgi:predicted membrane-bound spermidine synthase